MAIRKDYDRGRNDGLSLALKVAREGGIEALEDEIKMRGVTGIHTALAKKELESALSPIKERLFDTIMAMSIHVLHDEFGFGQKRIQQFADRFMEKTECVANGLLDFQDIVDTVETETGFELVIRMGDGVVVTAKKSA